MQAMPRSPAARLPAGLLISTWVRPAAFSRVRSSAAGVIVGRGIFDPDEAGARRGVEAIEKRHFAEQETEVRTKARHGTAPFQG
jgi:hypothetical protein